MIILFIKNYLLWWTNNMTVMKYANFVWISMEVKLLLQVKCKENKIWNYFLLKMLRIRKALIKL